MVEVTPAKPADIPALAELFQQAFPEALTAVFGRPRIDPQAVEDVLRWVYQFEPDGFLTARDAMRIAGFTVVVHDLAGLYSFLLLKGGLISLATRYCLGRYHGLGFGFIPNIVKAWIGYRSGDRGAVLKKPLAQVITIVVDQPYRGRGIGKTLSECALEYLRSTSARTVRLEVDASKTVPIALYKKMGFTERSVIRSPRGPALVMTLQLKEKGKG